MQRLLEEVGELGTDGALLPRELEGLPDLAQDLVLPDDHRLDAGGDAQEMADGVLARVEPEDPGIAMVVGSRQLLEGRSRGARFPGRHVELDPVARAQEDHLVDDLLGREPLEGRARLLRGGELEMLDVDPGMGDVHADEVDGDFLFSGAVGGAPVRGHGVCPASFRALINASSNRSSRSSRQVSSS